MHMHSIGTEEATPTVSFSQASYCNAPARLLSIDPVYREYLSLLQALLAATRKRFEARRHVKFGGIHTRLQASANSVKRSKKMNAKMNQHHY